MTTKKKTDPFQVKHIWVVGVGGVGGILVHYLWKIFNRKGITLHLMDGDNYTLSNLDRQYFNSFGNKAVVTAEHILSQPSVFLKIKPYAHFYGDSYTDNTLFQEGSIVFCAADNHWCRMKTGLDALTRKDIMFFSGGNEYTDGNVQFFVRKDGELIAGDYLDTYHKELSPTEVGSKPNFRGSCDTKGDPQLLVTNLNVAAIMLNTLWTILDGKEVKYSEIYFDVVKNTSKSIDRSLAKVK